MKLFTYTLLLPLALIVSACTSISTLPDGAEQVSFELGKEGKTGWSEYQDSVFLRGVDARTAYMAAKAGMGNAGFKVKVADFENGVVKGEHGMTLVDWNIVAGAYIKETPEGTWVKVISEGSKDWGITGDDTAGAWPQEILQGVRNYIRDESLITDPNKGHFQ